MKHEEEFRTFLTTVRVSWRNMQHSSQKAASDVISRCKKVERCLAIELSPCTLSDDAAFEVVRDQIKVAELGATPGKRYGYNDQISAVRAYREFVAWRDNT